MRVQCHELMEKSSSGCLEGLKDYPVSKSVWKGLAHREATKTVIITAFEDAQDQLVEQCSNVKVRSEVGMELAELRLSRDHEIFLGEYKG
jgi:hypothetical protein